MADLLKLKLELTADASSLVGGVNAGVQSVDRLKEANENAARSLADATGNVVRLTDAERQQVRGLLDTLHPAAARARDLQEQVALLDRAQQAGEISTRQHAAAVAELHHQHRAANDSAAGLGGTIGTLTTGMQALGAAIAVDRIVAFGRAAILTAADYERLDRRLKGLVGTGGALADTQLWLKKTADQLGTSVSEMTDGYARFLNLAKGGLVTVAQARDLTVGLRDAQAHFAADGDRMGDVMYGLGQALASPIVHMEELNQVTEPLPGLLLDLDKAAGVSAGGFRRLVNEGKVSSELFRDTLIKALKGYAGEAEKAAQGVEGAWARLENARKRFMGELGKQALPGATSASDYGASAFDLGTRIMQWVNRGQEGAYQLYGNQRFDELLAKRDAREKDLARYRAGAGGVYANRNAAQAQRDLADLNAELDDLTRRQNRIAQAAAGNDGWAEMWGVAGDGIGYVASAAERLAGPLDILLAGLDLTRGKSGLLATSQTQLATAMGTLAKVAALPPPLLKELGLTAGDVAMVMDRLREKLDPVAKLIKDINDETAALKVPEGPSRDLYQALDKAEKDKGAPLSDQEVIGVTDAVRGNREAKADNRIEQLRQEREATERLAAARASGSQAAVVAAQADNAYWAEFRRSKDDAKAREAWTETYKQGMADLSAQTGEATVTTSRQARQMLALAAAYGQGGEAVARVELANRIENETAKSGAGAHSDLAKAITEEEAARRKLAASQWDRELTLQIDAAKALAQAEREGAKAVALTSTANAAAAQIEKEGVATDSDRAKAIRAKTAELAKWQEQQGYERALRTKADELALARLELSLQGEGETIRARTLELARAELEIRAQFPRATEEEVAALLRKHEAVLRVREQIAQQRGLWDEIANLGERAFDRVGEAITQAFAEGKAATINWGGVAKAVMSEVVQAAVKLAVVNPIKNWMNGGSAPTLWSMFSAGGQPAGAQQAAGQPAAAAAGGGISPTQAAGAGYALSGATPSWWGTPIGYTAPTAAPVEIAGNGMLAGGEGARALGTQASATAGGVTWGQLATGAGVVLNGFNALNQFRAGQPVAATGSLIGAAAGVASLVGVQGTMLAGLAPFLGPAAILAPIAGMLLQGLFARKPSNKEGNAEIAWNTADDAISIGGMEGKKFSQANRDAAGDIAESMRVLGRTLEAHATSKLTTPIRVAVGDRDGLRLDYAGKSTNYDRSDAGIGQLTGDAARLMAAELGDSLPASIRTAVAKIDWSDLQAALSDLDFAIGFRDQLDAMSGALDPVNNQIKQFTANAKSIGEQIKTNITDWADTARRLGLATDAELVPAMQTGVLTMMGLGAQVEPLRGVAGATKQAEINFEAYRPVLVQFGMDVDALRSQYIDKAVDDYKQQVGAYTWRGADAVAQTVDPNVRASGAHQALNLGLDEKTTPNLFRGLSAYFDKANAGMLAASDINGVLRQLDTNLVAGRITGDQYNTAIQAITTAYKTSGDTLRQEAEKVRQAQTEIVAGWSRVRDGAVAAINSLRLDANLSSDNAATRIATAEGLLKDAYDRVMTGKDKDGKALTDAQRQQAADDFNQLWRPYLEQSRDYYASLPEYQAREGEVLRMQSAIRDRAVDQIGVAQRQLDALESIDARLAANDNAIANPGRQWFGAGNGANLATNMALARPYQLSTGGTVRFDLDFGGGLWGAWIKSMPEEVKQQARQRLRDAGQASRIDFATGAAFVGEGVYHRPTTFPAFRIAEAGPEGVFPLANIGGRLGVRAVIDAPTIDVAPVVAAVGGCTGAVLEVGRMIAEGLHHLADEVANQGRAIDALAREQRDINHYLRKRA